MRNSTWDTLVVSVMTKRAALEIGDRASSGISKFRVRQGVIMRNVLNYVAVLSVCFIITLPAHASSDAPSPPSGTGGGDPSSQDCVGSSGAATLSCEAALATTSAGSDHRFGSHSFQYVSGAIFPNNVSQDEKDTATAKFYDAWKTRYLVQGCGTGRYYVKGGGGSSQAIAVSEGQGYGMIITALMAGYDPDAQRYFDGIFKFARDHGSRPSPYLMSWIVDSDCRMPDRFSAVDADIDMAFSLLLADKQWGSSGAIDYRQEAKNMLRAMKAYIGAPTFFLGNSSTNTVRSSDLIGDHFRAFAAITGDATWSSVLDESYSIISIMQDRYAPKTGLIPDWIMSANTPAPAPASASHPGTDGGAKNNTYNWNACRIPLRIGTDWLVSGDQRAWTAAQKLASFFRTATGGDPSRIWAGYNISTGSSLPDANWNNMAFAAPVAVALMSDPESQSFLNDLWAAMTESPPTDYYADSLRLLSMIVVSGNWWAPA